MSLVRARHPEQLPWYAGGLLDAAHAAAIERHLQGCDSCRAEVRALRSVYRGIRDEASTAHISTDRLVAYHTRDPRVSEDDRRLIEEHVPGCHTCSADLAALDRAEASTHARHGRRWLGAAASVLIVVTVGWRFAGRRAESPASPAVARVVFSPAQRGTSGDPRLVGAGPWELEIWLPLHASAGEYRASIHRGDEPSKTFVDRIVKTGPKDGSVLLSVPRGLPPGHYVLSLIPRGDSVSENVVNGFDVEGPR